MLDFWFVCFHITYCCCHLLFVKQPSLSVTYGTGPDGAGLAGIWHQPLNFCARGSLDCSSPASVWWEFCHISYIGQPDEWKVVRGNLVLWCRNFRPRVQWLSSKFPINFPCSEAPWFSREPLLEVCPRASKTSLMFQLI